MCNFCQYFSVTLHSQVLRNNIKNQQIIFIQESSSIKNITLYLRVRKMEPLVGKFGIPVTNVRYRFLISWIKHCKKVHTRITNRYISIAAHDETAASPPIHKLKLWNQFVIQKNETETKADKKRKCNFRLLMF